MTKIHVYRSLIAAAVIAAVWYLALLSQASELRPMVVVGIQENRVALKHPTAECPRVGVNPTHQVTSSSSSGLKTTEL